MLSKEDSLQILKDFYQNNDGKVSRDLFRREGYISESSWIKLFGTWQEYKRQAGIIPTREEVQLVNQIAKHASTDSYRDLNIEKSSLEGNYLKPSTKRFQTVLIGSDIHDLESDPFWIRLFMDTADRIQPEKIILNGDIFDNPEFSKYHIDPREYDIEKRVKWVNDFCYNLRITSPSSEINMIEGNHEARLVKLLQINNPQIIVLLSSIHGMRVKDLLKLDDNEINYYAKSDLSAFNKIDMDNELAKNFIIIEDQLVCHHFPEGKDFGYPGVHGHNHKHIVWPAYSPRFGAYEWHQMGCGHRRQASYTNGERWGNGFMIAHLDTQKKRTQFEYIDTTHDFCVIGGKFYQRNEQEKAFYI